MGYPIIENSNYHNDRSERSQAVHAARLAIEACEPWALTAELEDSLQDLELALAIEMNAAGGYVRASSQAAIESAETDVESAFLAAQAARNATRES